MKTTIIALTLAVGMGVTAQAALVTYTFSGTASGSIGATQFTNTAFTIRVFADTDSVVQETSTLFTVEDISSTLDIAGLAPAVFTLGERMFDSQTLQALGFARSASRGSADLLDLENNVVFATYDLRSSFGPIFSPTTTGFFANEPTTLGGLFLNARDVTFTAVVVPEPSSLVLLGIGSCIALWRRVRERKIPRETA